MATLAEDTATRATLAKTWWGNWDNQTIANYASSQRAKDALASPKSPPAAPRPRYGYPGAAKGAIYALDPNDASRGDILYFSRFPETLNETIEAMLATATLGGRAHQPVQQMGAKGVRLTTELWFCDVFMWSADFSTQVGQVRQNWSLPHATPNPKYALAEQARIFFELYMAGHDGTGLALPPADLYLHWGDRPYPIPIVIEKVDMTLEHFLSAETRPGFPGAPQTVTAKLDMIVAVPLVVTDPFRPKKPAPRKPGKPKKLDCVVPGMLIDATVIKAAVSALNDPSAPGSAEDRLSVANDLLDAVGDKPIGYPSPGTP